MKIQAVLIGALLTMSVLGTSTRCCAEHEPTAESITVADSVWYDADSKDLLPITVRDERTDTMNRDSRWTPKPNGTKTQTTPTKTTATPWGSMSWGNLLGWVFLVMLMGVVVGLLVYVFANSSFDFRPVPVQQVLAGKRALDEQTKQRIAELPAELRDTDVNPRTELERLMQRGDFDQAIIFLYGHQLLLLDRVSWLRLSRWKTNRQYVRETRGSNLDIGELLGRTVEAFERSYFGRHSLTRPQFDVLWKDNLRLEASVAAQGDHQQ